VNALGGVGETEARHMSYKWDNLTEDNQKINDDALSKLRNAPS
jgi:hypothetical protein